MAHSEQLYLIWVERIRFGFSANGGTKPEVRAESTGQYKLERGIYVYLNGDPVPRVFVGNFDFEHELAMGRSHSSASVRNISAELASAWIAVADEGDLIWSPAGIPNFDFGDWFAFTNIAPRFIQHEQQLPYGSDWELVPWGWTESVLSWGTRFSWNCPAPPLETVKLANSRVFRWELEARLNVTLPWSTVLTSIDQLIAHVADFAAEHPNLSAAGWVVKANFGMAGRERQLGRGPVLTTPILNWARKRLHQGPLVFEPWLERIAEAGIQIDIPRQGEPQLLGVLPLLTDSTGTYRGSRIQCDASEVAKWQSAVEIALQVAHEIQRTGYFGPLGTDAMQYRDDLGQLRIRPLQDLNVRCTMGRLGLGLRRFVNDQAAVDWLHDPRLVAQFQAEKPGASILRVNERSWLVQDVLPQAEN